ncbi:hypothetical protein LJC61_05340 [Ruminococcaceae bacterium OttesenSCG-928-A16]|nr:hypothetical protein [Ruminococcaceae bacterium OttesenSCG-928-A16]
MLDGLVVILCFYIAYSNAKSLLEVPFSEWQLVHYLLVLVTVGLVAVAVFRALRMFKTLKSKKAEDEADAVKAQQDKALKAAQAKQEEEDELAQLDLLDQEEKARKAAEDASNVPTPQDALEDSGATTPPAAPEDELENSPNND